MSWLQEELRMIHERQKASKILEELIEYLIRNGANHIEMSLSFQPDYVKIHVEGDCPVKPANFHVLHDLLNAPRRPELDGYYYELLGSSVRQGEMKLLGSLVDRAETEYEKGRLSITVYRSFN